MARQVVDFPGLLLGCVFSGLLTCAASVPILGPKYGLQVGAKNTILTAIICVRFLATSRAGALERFHECLLSGASTKNAARSSHAFKKNEVKQQADMRPRRRGGYCTLVHKRPTHDKEGTHIVQTDAAKKDSFWFWFYVDDG